MKRSFINQEIFSTITLLEENKIFLPPFSKLTPNDWKEIMSSPDQFKKYQNIINRGLGWDITDRGQNDFYNLGLTLFTLRNGVMGTERDYSEKLLIVKENQLTPWHYHWKKCEDIINRGGGNLLIEVCNAPEDDIGPFDEWKAGVLSDSEVKIVKDGIISSVPHNTQLTIKPGESITVFPKVFHKFWGEEGTGTVMVGEVSKVNDDYYDSRFKDKLQRFPNIEEDEAPHYVLCNEYKKYK